MSLADAYARIQNDAIEQSLQVIQFACVDTDSSARLETVRVGFVESLLIHVSGIETQGGFADAVQLQADMSRHQFEGVPQCLAVAKDFARKVAACIF